MLQGLVEISGYKILLRRVKSLFKSVLNRLGLARPHQYNIITNLGCQPAKFIIKLVLPASQFNHTRGDHYFHAAFHFGQHFQSHFGAYRIGVESIGYNQIILAAFHLQTVLYRGQITNCQGYRSHIHPQLRGYRSSRQDIVDIVPAQETGSEHPFRPVRLQMVNTEPRASYCIEPAR